MMAIKLKLLPRKNYKEKYFSDIVETIILQQEPGFYDTLLGASFLMPEL